MSLYSDGFFSDILLMNKLEIADLANTCGILLCILIGVTNESSNGLASYFYSCKTYGVNVESLKGNEISSFFTAGY